MTDLERTFPHQLHILNSSQELHYHSGYNKKTLERDVLNDQRLSRKMVEKWPIYFLPPFGRLNGFFFFFSIQQSVHCCSMDTRGQSECREHRRLLQQGANLLGSVIRRPFTQQGPEWMHHFSEGIRNFYKNTSRSGGGQSGFQYLFIFVHKDDRIRMNKNCCSIWFKKKTHKKKV